MDKYQNKDKDKQKNPQTLTQIYFTENASCLLYLLITINRSHCPPNPFDTAQVEVEVEENTPELGLLP